MSFFKRLFCRHKELEFVRNLHGDEIIEHGWKRSVWECVRCGTFRFQGSLFTPPPRVKYLLCPDYVRSRADGDRHYITPPTLARLYGVSLQECVVWPNRGRWLYGGSLIWLYPREDGDYRLPESPT